MRTLQIAKATLPDDLEGYEVMVLCPEFMAVEQLHKIIHASLLFRFH